MKAKGVEVLYGALVPNGLPGGVMVLQTAGDALRFNPDIHSLLTDGAFTPDGKFHQLP